MDKIKKLKKILGSQGRSGNKKSIFMKFDLPSFNKKEGGTELYVEFAQQGQSDTYHWLLIRENDQYGKILKERTFRKEFLKKFFHSEIERLKNKVSPNRQSNEDQLTFAF